MLTGRTGQRTTAPAAPLMDYEAGRSEPKKLAWAVAFAAGGMLVLLPLGGALAIVCRPPEYGEWGGWALLGFCVGIGVAILGLILAIVPMADVMADAAAHRRRVREAFQLELELRESAGGVVVHEEFEEFCFYAERPNDMLLIITALTRRAQTDPQWRPSIATLIDEGVWVGRRKLGNVNTSQARKILTELSEMGFITGRTDGSAGEWVYKELDAAVDRYERKG